MIAKGLDFPRVTLVGVINADIGLHLPDFRSCERTFQLLSQVAGRAGRGRLAGESRHPDLCAGPLRRPRRRGPRLSRLRGARTGREDRARISTRRAHGPDRAEQSRAGGRPGPPHSRWRRGWPNAPLPGPKSWGPRPRRSRSCTDASGGTSSCAAESADIGRLLPRGGRRLPPFRRRHARLDRPRSAAPHVGRFIPVPCEAATRPAAQAHPEFRAGSFTRRVRFVIVNRIACDLRNPAGAFGQITWSRRRELPSPECIVRAVDDRPRQEGDPSRAGRKGRDPRAGCPARVSDGADRSTPARWSSGLSGTSRFRGASAGR